MVSSFVSEIGVPAAEGMEWSGEKWDEIRFRISAFPSQCCGEQGWSVNVLCVLEERQIR